MMTEENRYNGRRAGAACRQAEYGKQIVAPLAQQLSWSHFRELIPIKDEKARLFYVREEAERHWGKCELRQSIERREYERTEIANLQIASPQSKVPFNIFKAPYFLLS